VVIAILPSTTQLPALIVNREEDMHKLRTLVGETMHEPQVSGVGFVRYHQLIFLKTLQKRTLYHDLQEPLPDTFYK
jgi:hypothetical protein